MDTLKKVRADERILLRAEQQRMLAHGVSVATTEPGFIRVDFDPSAPVVMLLVTEAIELHDGDLIAAGEQWLAYQAPAGSAPARLDLLDRQGDVLLSFTLDRPSFSLGRKSGDVILGRDMMLSSQHMQVLVRPEGVFLQDLGSSNGTWTMVRPGEQLPAGSVLEVGDRLFRVDASTAVGGTIEDQRTRPIDLHSAA